MRSDWYSRSAGLSGISAWTSSSRPAALSAPKSPWSSWATARTGRASSGLPASLALVARSGSPGRISDAELDGLLAAAVVVTSASEHEAFGLIVADGLAAGARVVASAIPAHREVGRLAGADAPIVYVDPANAGEFSAALAAALAMGRPPAGRVRLPSWGDVAGQLRELYGEVAPRDRQARRREPA